MIRPTPTCEERQARCQNRFWWLIAAGFAYTTACWTWTWWVYYTGSTRATMLEKVVATAQREADKLEGRVEGISANFKEVNKMLAKIQDDLSAVKIAVARLEARAERALKE